MVKLVEGGGDQFPPRFRQERPGVAVGEVAPQKGVPYGDLGQMNFFGVDSPHLLQFLAACLVHCQKGRVQEGLCRSNLDQAVDRGTVGGDGVGGGDVPALGVFPSAWGADPPSLVVIEGGDGEVLPHVSAGGGYGGEDVPHIRVRHVGGQSADGVGSRRQIVVCGRWHVGGSTEPVADGVSFSSHVPDVVAPLADFQ